MGIILLASLTVRNTVTVTKQYAFIKIRITKDIFRESIWKIAVLSWAAFDDQNFTNFF